MIATEDEQVGLRQQREGFFQIGRRSDVVAGGLGGKRICSEEERGEVMRAARAGEEHAKLANLTRAERLTESLGGLGIVLGEQVARSVVGLTLAFLACLRCIVILAAGRIRRTTDLDGDGHGRRGDLGVRGTEDQLIDDLVAFDWHPEGAHLTAFAGQELTGGLRTRDVTDTIIVGEVTTALEDFLLHFSAEEMHFGDHSDGVVCTPTANGAKEVNTISHGADRNLHLLREGFGIDTLTIASLENDDVQAVLRGLGVDNLIRDAVGLNFTELGERQGITLGLLVSVEAGRGGGGEGRAKVEQAESSDGLAFGADRDATEVGDDVAQTFGTQSLKAFGHERVRAALATNDITDFEFG